MAPDLMRLFVAVKPPPEILARLEVAQRRLKSPVARAGITWAKPAQVHVTLKFLGDVPLAALGELQAALGHACAGTACFELSAEGLGVFPDAREPRVIWAGLRGDLETLGRLRQRIEAASRPWCLPETREFKPHLTLGRVRRINPSRAQALSGSMDDPRAENFGGWRVDAVDLMQSVLSPNGAAYTRLSSHRLLGS
jgi:2'-5' RNA ligase